MSATRADDLHIFPLQHPSRIILVYERSDTDSASQQKALVCTALERKVIFRYAYL